ncbi:nucleotide pyrophosphohydrolase [Candidatus Pacearchaeota archaeon]|nr:nucleotide pyrophosphohydrolase [Candidatus Pacearchaeota archaeon]
MEIKETQEKVDKIIKQYGGYWEPLSMLARLVEEVGELSRELNIEYGGKKKKSESDGREIQKELADITFTILAIANALKIDLNKEINEKIEKDLQRNRGIYY